MIDLKKLEEKFDALFTNETESSFNEWLIDKLTREAIETLGEGRIERKISTNEIVSGNLLNIPIKFECPEPNGFPGNTQYAMAA